MTQEGAVFFPIFVTADFLTVFEVCLRSVTRCHTCSYNGSLIIVIEPLVNFLLAAILSLYVLQKHLPYDVILFKDPF